MRPALPPLLLGLALGATAGWFLARPSSSGSDLLATRYSPPATLLLPAWSWRDAPTPPVLAPDSIGPVIAAWRGLRAADGSPASYPARADALRMLLARLPAGDFPRLLATLVPAETAPDQRLRQLAFDTWVETDAPAAARWAAVTGPDLRDLARQAVRAWAAFDADAAATWACALRDAETAQALAAVALAKLAKSDPARALALVSPRGDVFQNAIFPDLFETLAKTDPAAAVRAHGAAIWNSGDGFSRMKRTLGAWAKRDPQAAVAWLVAQPRTHSGMLVSWLADIAQTRDESLRIAAILANDASIPDRAEALAHLIRRFSDTEPDKAIAWLDAKLDADLRRQVLLKLGASYTTDHPEASLPYALAQPAGQNRTRLIANLLDAWTKTNSSAALAWLQKQTDPGVLAAGTKIQATLLADISRAEPHTSAAEWESLSDPLAKKLAIGPIAEAWGKTDPAAALQWAAARQRALDPDSIYVPPVNLLYSWAQKEPEPALRWVESYVATLSGPHKDWLALDAMLALGRNDYDRAPRGQTGDLYLKIQDDTLRTKILDSYTANWITNDKAAAHAWIQSHRAALPEQVVEMLKLTK